MYYIMGSYLYKYYISEKKYKVLEPNSEKITVFVRETY